MTIIDNQPPKGPTESPIVQETRRAVWKYVWAALGFTVFVNLLLLVAPIYMLQVYDRVLSSGSRETLIVLTFIAVFMLLMYIAAEGGRKRVLANAGRHLGFSLDRATLQAGFNNARVPPSAVVESVSNLSRVQSFLINATITPLLDMPFAPFFIAILYFIHPVLFGIGLIGAIVLLLLAILSNSTARKSIEDAAHQESQAQTLLAHTVRQRAAIVSMGISEKTIDRWKGVRQGAIDESLRAVNVSNFLSATSKSFRQILQVAVLGGAAWLSLQQEVTPGAIIASSIIMGRGLAPIDQVVAIWHQLIRTRQSWADLKSYIQTVESASAGQTSTSYTKMTRPDPVLKLEEFSVAAPGATKALLPKLSFELPAGSIVALLGPSGSGKTSLLQTLSGAWMPARGTARLGSRDIHTWHPEDRGRFVGYLPQHVELLTGTVFQNIARFTDASAEDVYTAANTAGCHDMILSLPEGYDTQIGGDAATHLSAGQRQCIGLARACFGSPALMLLDEPTAHLDSNMVSALLKYFADISRTPASDRESVYLVATHDPRIINAADRILIIQNGKVGLMPREEYLRKVSDLNQKRAQLNPTKNIPDGSSNSQNQE